MARARKAERGDGPQDGHQQGRKRAGQLVPQAAFQFGGRPPGVAQISDRGAQFGKGHGVRIDPGQRELVGPDRIAETDGANLPFRAAGHVELACILQYPALAGGVIMAARRLDDGRQAVVHAVENLDLAQLHGIAPASDDRGSDKVVAVADPGIGFDAAIGGHRTVIHRLPRAERCGCAGNHAFIEGVADDGDAERGGDQRRQYLVRGQARSLHRYDLAILVHAREHDERAQKHREGQETRDDLRYAKADIMPQLRIAVTGIGQDVP